MTVVDGLYLKNVGEVPVSRICLKGESIERWDEADTYMYVAATLRTKRENGCPDRHEELRTVRVVISTLIVMTTR